MHFLPVLLQTVSIVVAATSVVIGVTAWRRSALGNRKLEIAEEAICLFSQIRDAFHEIRSPFGYGGEGGTRVRSENESEDESDTYDKAFVAIERSNRYSELFAKAYALKHRFAFYFGDDNALLFDEVFEIRGDILSASQRLRRDWNRQRQSFRTQRQFESHLERIEESEAIFWEGSSDVDPIAPRMDSIFEKVEAVCKNTLNPKPVIWFQLANLMRWILSYLGLVRHR